MEGRQGDQVGFVVSGNGEEGVADLFDLDCARERGLLCIVTFKLSHEESDISDGEDDKDLGHCTWTPCLSFQMQ